MANNRNISDVVLKLEQDFALLKKYVQNINNDLKILISNNNITNKNIEVLLNNLTQPLQKRPTVTAPDETLSLPKVAEPVIKPFVGDDVLEEEYAIKKGKQRSQRKKADSLELSQVAVSQQIMLSDGKPLFLADVSIYDQNGEFIRKVRTNAKGKWLCALKIDTNYFIVIQKKESNKKSIELRYDIDIPSETDGKPVELPPRVLE